MTVTFGFYNSVASDRTYNATQISSMFDGIIKDGVFAHVGSAMVVTANSGMGIRVGAGRAWFNRTWTENDAVLNLTVTAANATKPRIDVVVLEVNASDAVRANSIKMVDGVAAASPVAPTMTNTTYVHQYPLAYVSVPAGATSISSWHIVNKVGTADCPFVTAPLASVDVSLYYESWEDQFRLWFDAMKDQLTSDAAGNLQTQVTALNGLVGTLEERSTHIASSHIQNSQILPNHLHYMASKVSYRGGGNPLDWCIPGSTTFTLVNGATIQVGSSGVSHPTLGTGSVNFPVTFGGAPVVIATPSDGAGSINAVMYTIKTGNVTRTGFEYAMAVHSNVAPYHAPAPMLTRFHWIAIGG